jgi:hypothetical protein
LSWKKPTSDFGNVVKMIKPLLLLAAGRLAPKDLEHTGGGQIFFPGNFAQAQSLLAK